MKDAKLAKVPLTVPSFANSVAMRRLCVVYTAVIFSIAGLAVSTLPIMSDGGKIFRGKPMVFI